MGVSFNETRVWRDLDASRRFNTSESGSDAMISICSSFGRETKS